MSGSPDAPAALVEGWGFPPRERSIHYYRGGISLCRRSQYAGRLFADGGSSSYLCGTCRKARAEEISRETRLVEMDAKARKGRG